ncbi:MAG: hypothetical protein OXF07_12640 [Rhodobacter sp.]|nr:hypothetical protein [Rhodobacter sp.]MCY4168873.1 hypothetical protein [Rhodobacter sp.]
MPILQGSIQGFGLTALAGASVLLLSGCGGGSDTTATPGRADILVAGIDVRAAATTRPYAGSVAQSSNATDGGVTSDTAVARYDGRGTRVTITRADGRTLELDSITDRVGPPEPLPSPLPGTTYHGERLVRADGDGATLAVIFTNWNNSDPTDYLAGGYWLQTDGPPEPGTPTRPEFGAFVDGPELDTAPTLPVAGTARYQGRGAGLYAYAGSSRLPDQAGEVRGNVDLTADFAAGTLSGCLGCRGPIEIDGVTVDGRPVQDPLPMRMHLDATRLDATTGHFQGAVRVSHDGDEIRVIDSSGSWGGQVSSRQVPGIDTPLIVVGTAGGEWTDSTGGQGAMVGAWWARLPLPPAP